MLGQLQLHRSGHLVRMDDKRLPKRLFYGDVVTASRRQGGQVQRYKDKLKTSLKRLQMDPAYREDLARDQLSWKRTVKKSSAIYEANRIPTAKVKRGATSNLPTMSADVPGTNQSYWCRLQHPDDTIWCSQSTSALLRMPTINTDRTPEPLLTSSSIASTSTATAPTTSATALSPDNDKHKSHHRHHQ
ncbi:hypothetical protein SprV_0100109500 [Sparganum proliferum]